MGAQISQKRPFAVLDSEEVKKVIDCDSSPIVLCQRGRNLLWQLKDRFASSRKLQASMFRLVKDSNGIGITISRAYFARFCASEARWLAKVATSL